MRLILSIIVLAGTAVAAAAACGLTFGPGDFGGAAQDGSINDAPIAIDGTLPDGAPAPSGKHLLVITGERDSTTDTAASDVWVAPIDAKGDVGAFATLQPRFFRGTLLFENQSGGRLRVASRGATGRAVEYVDFESKGGVGSGITGAWKGAIVPTPNTFGSWGQIFSGSSLLALGGGATLPKDGGGTTFVRDDSIQISPFVGDEVGYGPLVASPTKLPIPLHSMNAVVYKDFIYLFGGDSGLSDQGSKVYVARINSDPNVAVDAFVETTRVVNPQNGQPHAPSGPMICAAESRMFMAGGNGSDIVVSTSINEADGTLGPWKAAPKLPGALRGAGCAVWNGALHLIGGIGATSRSDRIIRARIGTDGTLGEWELSAGEKLPAARSSIIALTY